VAVLARIAVNQLMQAGTRGHRVEQQDQGDQQRRDGGPAGLNEISFAALQGVSILSTVRWFATGFAARKTIIRLKLAPSARKLARHEPY
jgi:hypothetical protein